MKMIRQHVPTEAGERYLIRVQEKEGKQLVSARELHEFLEVKSRFNDWVSNRVKKYGFTENTDFITVTKNLVSGGKENDLILTLETSKMLAMVENNEKGMEARKYFIELEKQWNTPEAVMARALQMSHRTLETYKDKVELLETKIKEDKPLVGFAETIEKANDGILVRDMSKILANEGIKLGERKLYSWYRERGLIMKNSTKPTQKAVEMGLFRVDEKLIKTVKGDRLTFTSKLTGKGQIYTLERLKEAA